MRCTIICRPTDTGMHSFYLSTGNASYFLFSQHFRRGVNRYFSDGVCLDETMDFSRAKGDSAIIRTMEKLPSHIRYIEREYDIEILRKTARRNAAYRYRAA